MMAWRVPLRRVMPRFPPMASWFQAIDDFANRTGRELTRLPSGRGVAFSDGFDVCWLLEGDLLSTLPAPKDEDSALRAIAEIERIDRIRRDVVHVLRHYLASKRYGVTLCRSGRWGIQTEGGLESSLSVGAYLTAFARDGNDLDGCIAQLLKHSIIRHAPTARRIQRYLDTPGNPTAERGFEDKTITLGGTSMGSILRMMNLCRAAGAIPDDPTVADGQLFNERIEKLEATGPVGEALLRVGERLPDVTPSFELFDNSIVMDFPDGLDCISMKVKSRTFIRAIRDDGPATAGDRIADDYERLSRLRGVTLHAIDTAAANLGWVIEEARTGVFTGSTVWHVGPDVRKRTIDVGQAMTDFLRNSSPELYFKRILSGPDEFTAACLDSLQKAVQIKPKSWIAPRGRLAPPAPSNVTPLVGLTDAVLIAELGC